MIEQYYTPQQMERWTGVTARHWRRLARKLAGSKKLGRRVLIPERSVIELLDSAELDSTPRGLNKANNGIVGRTARSLGKHK